MLERAHNYRIQLSWTGNLGVGTAGYKEYSRNHLIAIRGKADLLASADPAFRGDPTRHTPEELLVASLSGCHMLWYLHLCADAGVRVLDYEDRANGTMAESPGSGGRFREVSLAPTVTIAEGSDEQVAYALHEDARARCFIANSMSFPVTCAPTILIGPGDLVAEQEA